MVASWVVLSWGDELNNLAVVGDTENLVSALVVDLADMSCLEVAVHDLNDNGCWIVSNKINLLKEQIGLRIEGSDKLLRANIVAYGDSAAEISFKVEFDEPTEKRREIRRPVWLTAVVCGRTHPVTMKCRVVDASKSGCRLEGTDLDRLPPEIEVSIPGLNLPIPGKIVWRKDNQAGVQLAWPFEPDPKPSTDILLQKLVEERQKKVAKPKKKVSAFGR